MLIQNNKIQRKLNAIFAARSKINMSEFRLILLDHITIGYKKTNKNHEINQLETLLERQYRSQGG